MDGTEIVNCAGPEHFEFEPLTRTGELARAAHQAWHPRPKGGIEALNIGGIDFATAQLREANECVNLLPPPKSQTGVNVGELASVAAFDDLNDVKIRPWDMTWSPRFAGIDFGMERPQNRFGIGGEPIDGEQDGLRGAGGRLRNFLHQPPNQMAGQLLVDLIELGYHNLEGIEITAAAARLAREAVAQTIGEDSGALAFF